MKRCPCCNRTFTERLGRTCSLCGQSIGRHDKYKFVGGGVQHKDCQKPQGEKKQLQPTLMEVRDEPVR